MKNVNFVILFAALVLFTAPTFAQDPQPPVGLFLFSPRLELLTVKKFEMVYTLTSEGKARLESLKKSGWTCVQQTASSLKCSLFLKGEVLPPLIAEQIQAKYIHLAIQFSKEYNLSLTNETDLLQEYVVSQNVEVSGKKVVTYLLRESMNSPAKIQMEVGWDKLHLIFLDETTLAIQETTIKQEKNASTLYLVEVHLEKSTTL